MGIEAIKLVSGGQTGADRAALDFAIEHQIPHGGWCPAGRLAEDGSLPVRYQLTETPDGRHAQRTEWNVRDSDGTVVLSIVDTLTGGTSETVGFARAHGKPVLHLWRNGGPAAPELALLGFIRDNGIKVLNVAGPRASQAPEVGAFVREVFERALALSQAGS